MQWLLGLEHTGYVLRMYLLAWFPLEGIHYAHCKTLHDKWEQSEGFLQKYAADPNWNIDVEIPYVYLVHSIHVTRLGLTWSTSYLKCI